jgi:GMP synthase (glutamine-hydrolysing)
VATSYRKTKSVTTVTEVPWAILHGMAQRILEIPGVNRVLYDLTPKPPATVEYI